MKIYNCDCEWEIDAGVSVGEGYRLVTRCLKCEIVAQHTRFELELRRQEEVRAALVGEEMRKLAEESLRKRGL